MSVHVSLQYKTVASVQNRIIAIAVNVCESKAF